MKSLMILTLPWLVMSLSWASTETGTILDTDFDSCGPENKWILTNTTIKWSNGELHIVSTITYANKSEKSPIYTIHITINDCKINASTSCTGEPHVWVEDVNCDNNDNLSENVTTVCKIAQEIGQKEKEKKWFSSRFDLAPGWGSDDLFDFIFCWNLEDTNAEYTSDNYSGDGDIDKSNESKKK